MRHRARILLIAAAALLPLHAANAQTLQIEPRERLLSVTGEGTVRAEPDMALVTLGVVSEAASAREALAENSASMSRIVGELRAAGAESRDSQTSGFSVEPVYSEPPRGDDGSRAFRPEIVGYRVRNELTLRIREMTRVGELLDQVVTLGANSISGPVFTVAAPTPLEDQARRAAIRDALRKGELYAEAARLTLGPIFRIEEGYLSPPQTIQAAPMMRMEASDASVPIEGGELAFRAQVSVSWRLGD